VLLISLVDVSSVVGHRVSSSRRRAAAAPHPQAADDDGVTRETC
jgi:hypothetical protein